MEKIVRCIYLISLATGWFSLKYDKKKKVAIYSKFIYRLGRFEFYFFAIMAGLGYFGKYGQMISLNISFDGIFIMLVLLQVIIYFVSIFKFYSRLKRLRFEIINFVNESLKIYKILVHSIDFKINQKFLILLILKLIFVDIAGIPLKTAYEIISNNSGFDWSNFLRTIFLTIFLNFLNLNNLHLIYLRSVFFGINKKLKEIFRNHQKVKRR